MTFDPEQVGGRVAWLWRHDARYRVKWGGRAEDATPPPGGPPPARPAPAPSRKADCVHLGDFLDTPDADRQRPDAAGVFCMCPGRWRRACDVFGECRVGDGRGPEKCCQGCERYESESAPPPEANPP